MPDDRQLMNHALIAAEDSRCARRGVGIVVSREGVPVIRSCNGTLSGEKDCYDVFQRRIESDEDRRLHKEFSPLNEIHAEQSVVAKAAQSGISLEGCEAHLNLIPCLPCLFTMVEAGIERVVYLEDRKDVAEDHERSDVAARLRSIGVSLVGPVSGSSVDPRMGSRG